MSFNKKLLLIIMTLALFFVSACSFAYEYSENDVIVMYKNSDSAELITASTNSYTKEIFSSLSNSENVYAIISSNTKTPEALANELLQNPNVIAASPNYKIYASAMPNDTYISECWGLIGTNGINAASAWDTSTGKDDVYVVVMDSGIDYNQPDLIDNLDKTHSYNVINTANSANDNNGHGTHIAGIIGAKGNNSKGIAGVNWNVKIIAVKVLDASGGGSIANVIKALDYIVNLIENEGLNIRAVNMSFETYLTMTPTSTNLVKFPLWRAFRELDELNKSVIVVAAGNYGETVGQPSTYAHGIVPGVGYYVYPASFKGINNLISVGAYDSEGAPASFTNLNATINAPGVEILSTWLTSESNEYSTAGGVSLKSIQGTSMAAPFVSGAAAFVASRASSEITAYQIKKILTQDTTSSSSVNASVATKLNLAEIVAFQNTYSNDVSVLPEDAPASAEYDDWESVDPEENTNTGGTGVKRHSSGGGCNIFSISFAIAAVAFFVKRKI